MNRIVAIAIITVLIVFTQTGLSQVPPNGEHSYGGTQEDTLQGNQTGTITYLCPNLGDQGCISGKGNADLIGPTETRIREYKLEQYSRPDGVGINRQVSPLNLGGDINLSASKTHIEVFIYTSSGSQTLTTQYDVSWDIDANSLSTESTCDTSSTQIRLPGGATAGAAGAGESRLTCTMDYQADPFTIESTINTNDNVHGSRQGYIVTQTEVYNYTPNLQDTDIEIEITSIHDFEGHIDGTWSGNSTGEHRGEIEQINATTNGNETSVENLTATNFTFSNIFGAIQLEFDLPFLLLVAAILLIVLAEWRKDPFILLLSVLPLIFYAIEVDNNNWRIIVVAFTLYAAARASMVIYESRKEGEEDDE